MLLQVARTAARLSTEEARVLTEEIKERAEELWHKLLEAYERGAHTSLGYSSWGAYFEAEFGGHQSRGYQLIDAGRVVRALEDHSTSVEQPNEAQARELAKLAKENPEEAVDVWKEVVEKKGADVTAPDVTWMLAGRKQARPRPRDVVVGPGTRSYRTRGLANVPERVRSPSSASTFEKEVRTDGQGSLT
jgi:hypothetical protein